jgi:hypothetical protein
VILLPFLHLRSFLVHLVHKFGRLSLICLQLLLRFCECLLGQSHGSPFLEPHYILRRQFIFHVYQHTLRIVIEELLHVFELRGQFLQFILILVL